MQIKPEDVEKVQALARLELTPEEKSQMTGQLSKILTYIEKLNELDTSNVEPMEQVLAPQAAGLTDSHPETGLRLRNDENRPSLPHQAVVEAAPDADETYVKVPKVIDR